jgi:hypothetical protein
VPRVSLDIFHKPADRIASPLQQLSEVFARENEGAGDAERLITQAGAIEDVGNLVTSRGCWERGTADIEQFSNHEQVLFS